jgi:AcrR family transcriptional regulator
MPSVEENKLKKRNKILDAAYNLFAKNGINTTPIDEVVKCAGVAKGTFYLYFHDKYDLMDQIILYKSAAIIKSVIAQMKNINTDNKMEAIDQLTFFVDAIVDAIIDYMIENKEMLSVISEKSSILYSLIIDNGDDNIKLDFDYLTDIIVKLGNPPENAKKLLLLVSTMIFTTASNAILSRSPFTIEEIRPEIHLAVKKMLA